MTYRPRDYLDPAEEAVLARVPAAKQKALVKAFNEWFDMPSGDGTSDPIVAAICTAFRIDSSEMETVRDIRTHLFHFRDNRIYEPRRLLLTLANLYAPAT